MRTLDGLCASLLGLSANSRRRHCPVGQVMSWSLAETDRRRAFANRISNEFHRCDCHSLTHLEKRSQ